MKTNNVIVAISVALVLLITANAVGWFLALASRLLDEFFFDGLGKIVVLSVILLPVLSVWAYKLIENSPPAPQNQPDENAQQRP